MAKIGQIVSPPSSTHITQKVVTLEMSSTRKSANKWLLVQWGSGSRSVVDLTSVISPTNNTNIVGTVVVADKGNGTHEAATVICSARDRSLLERQISPKATVNDDDDDAGPSKPDYEGEDFSASGGSSWSPSDEHVSTDEEEVDKKKIKLEPKIVSRRCGRVIKPSHRADAINQILESRKRTHKEIKNAAATVNSVDKSTTDPARKNPPVSDIVSINVQDILSMKQCFHDLFRLLKEMKPANIKQEANNTTVIENRNDSDASDRSRSEDLNRSDDNVLITNKYGNTYEKNNRKALAEKDTNEWVAIGSGQTLIHRSQFNKVNWKSYTVATRTLLLAVFPRRILATHSLTGKKSPAFQCKPPKMCLDPKIVSDVVIEITARFGVKENLVRSIITTKCADECKMLRSKRNKQKRTTVSFMDGPAEAAEGAVETNDANQTC